MGKSITHSKWHDELEIFYQIKHGIILEGNIRDTYLYSDEEEQSTLSLSLTQYLTKFFEKRGYSSIICYDHLDGFKCHSNLCENNTLEAFAELVGNGLKVQSGFIKADFSDLESGAPYIIRKAVSQSKKPVVIIMDLVSRYIESPDNLTEGSNKAFTILQQAVVGARDALGPNGSLRNIIIFIVNKKNDLPAWMFLDFQQVKGIKIEYPDSHMRRQYLSGNNLRSFFDEAIFQEDSPKYTNNEKEWKRIVDKFVARTEGFSNNELQQLQKLCRMRKIHMKDLCSVVDLYIYGIQENPWENDELILNLKKNGKADLTRRVKGQDYAIDKTLDVIRRSVTGLSKVRNSNGLSPKGILFYAGPTGTGKTETAKALAQLIFGDESACIRFDMSEYRQDNSDQRLMGAPPGYVGYEAGGQLTNAVKDNPFSILLFDEIEKANPSILDKFLQILDDGRMTDGQGNTVYFNDCIIIFTSNLGIYTIDQQTGKRVPNVEFDTPYQEMQNKVRSAIEEYFVGLGKPELLNRIGENIVVFNYIHEDAARKILDMRLTKIQTTIREEKGIELKYSDEARTILCHECFKNLNFGGRGINNIVEALLINPLARHIFDESPNPGTTYRIERIMVDASPVDIEWVKID